jgi:hypothetical protein
MYMYMHEPLYNSRLQDKTAETPLLRDQDSFMLLIIKRILDDVELPKRYTAYSSLQRIIRRRILKKFMGLLAFLVKQVISVVLRGIST